MAKHTPGPWTYHKLADGKFSVVHWGPLAYLEKEADAALMAAAPDLLEACENALVFIRQLEQHSEEKLPGDLCHVSHYAAYHEDCMAAAIDKAEA